MFKTLLSNLLGGWSAYVMVALFSVCGVLFAAWRLEAADHAADIKRNAEYKAKVEAAGEEAERVKKEVETQHNRTLKEVTDAWEKHSGEVRRQAVANYLARYGAAPPAGGVSCSTSEVPVPGHAKSAEVLHGTEQERVSGPDAFIANCAEDALFRIQVRTWVEGNHLEADGAD